MMKILYNDLWRGKTLTVSSEVVGYLGTNTQHEHLSRKWRTTGLAAEWVKIDAGAGLTVTADALSMIDHNLTPSATVRVQANATDAWAAPSLDVLADPSLNIVLSTFTAQAYRFWRVLIDDPANPDGYVEVGRIYLCLKWEAVEHIDQPLSLGYDDTTLKEQSMTGQVFADIGVRQRLLKFSMGTMLNSTKRALETILGIVRLYDPVVIVFDDAADADGYAYVERAYATFTKWIVFTNAGGWLWTDDGIELKEAL